MNGQIALCPAYRGILPANDIVAGGTAMRAFVLACIAAVVLAGAGAIGLSFIQKPVSVAFSTDAVRL
jgi:hypothetical protein